jgi:hypothetical protein
MTILSTRAAALSQLHQLASCPHFLALPVVPGTARADAVSARSLQSHQGCEASLFACSLPLDHHFISDNMLTRLTNSPKKSIGQLTTSSGTLQFSFPSSTQGRLSTCELAQISQSNPAGVAERSYPRRHDRSRSTMRTCQAREFHEPLINHTGASHKNPNDGYAINKHIPSTYQARHNDLVVENIEMRMSNERFSVNLTHLLVLPSFRASCVRLSCSSSSKRSTK